VFFALFRQLSLTLSRLHLFMCTVWSIEWVYIWLYLEVSKNQSYQTIVIHTSLKGWHATFILLSTLSSFLCLPHCSDSLILSKWHMFSLSWICLIVWWLLYVDTLSFITLSDFLHFFIFVSEWCRSQIYVSMCARLHLICVFDLRSVG